MLRLKKDASPDTDVTPVSAETAPDGIALQKKGLPPAALIGIAVGALALAGLAAYLLTRPKVEPGNTTLVTTTPRIGMGANDIGANAASPGAMRAPGMPGAMSPRPAMPGAVTGMSGAPSMVSPGAAAPGMASPGGAISSAARAGTTAGVAPPVPVVSAAPVRPGPGAPPTLAPPTAAFRPNMTPITPTLKAQLDILWQRGADAKHNGDFNAARAYWKQALRLRPGHPGFAEAIRKLPPQQGNRRR